MTEQVKIAVIGGSGLYKMPEISALTSVALDTPFGKPSADIMIGTLRGKRVAFLPRHGVGHIYSPSDVPYKANIYALKTLGVRFILSVNACGSLQEEYAPGHLVIPTQLYDHTKSERGGRTFFKQGLVGHVSVADSFSPELAQHLYAATQTISGTTVHFGGTLIIIEGPRFSTKGESLIYRQWGCSVIGMTACPEAFLAREAEIAYATITHVTDYDVWHESIEPVTSDMVIATMSRNLVFVQTALANAIETLDENAVYPSHTALDAALITVPDAMSQTMLDELQPILARRFAQS